MFPMKGAAAEAYGTMNVDGVDFARREIAQATKTLDGAMRVRRVALVACDDSVDPMRAAKHLVDDVGVPAILGFGSGQKLVDVAGSLLTSRGVLAVASLTSSPLVTRLPQPPDLPRLVWRTTFGLDRVATATARIVHDVLEPRVARGKVRVALAREDSAATAWFADALYKQLAFNGKTAVENDQDYREITFPMTASSDADVASVADRIALAAPSVVILLGTFAATTPMVEAVESRWKGGARPTYVVANDTLELFASFLGDDVDRRRRLFAIESKSVPENARFVVRYNEAHRDQVSRALNPGVSYDAFYLLAYATFALQGENVTGAALGRAVARLVPPGKSIEVGPSHVFDALTALARDGRIDLLGTQSSLDFDLATGEVPFDFALLCAAVGPDGRATPDSVESGVVYRAKTGRIEGTMRCP